MNPRVLTILCLAPLVAPRTTFTAEPLANPEAVSYLTETARRLLAGCQVPASDGTSLYTPDGKGNYRALWTRDFAYMVENAGDLLPPDHIEAGIRFLVHGIRADGAAPDRVQPDGTAVHVAGSSQKLIGEPNIDNAQFLVIAADECLRRTPAPRRLDLFREWAPALKKAMDYIPRNSAGLVFNDPAKPHSPYGFTDCIAKTGDLFFESLLYWTACRRLAAWHVETKDAAQGAEFQRRAALIEAGIAALWDDRAGAYLAATCDCRQIDIWGNAYAIWLDFPLGPKRTRVLRFLETNYDRYVWRGQVRHLLKGEYWRRFLVPVPPERYQNGAYWATASGWTIYALAQKNPALARRTWEALISDFKSNGVCECINADYRKLESYVVSATNPLAAAKRLGY